ncbi:HAD hydrolase-like protein, partial [Arthrobacter sp. JCM 19049]|uniref:HAD hydrolase-like protein n=1 Tax=Arthrobacter sp. JCM 19049 TaxID=1460643 RepID=UPI002795C62D
MAAALREADLDPAGSVVVGDRYYDLDAARENAVRSIGVRWGFAQGAELEAADHVVESS